MQSEEIAKLADALRWDAKASPVAQAVAVRLDAVAVDVASLEGLPVPEACRAPERPRLVREVSRRPLGLWRSMARLWRSAGPAAAAAPR